MKKIFIAIITIISVSLILNSAAADGLISSSSTLTSFTNKTGKVAGFNPEATVGTSVSSIIKMALSLLAIIFMVLMISAGFQWMTAGGNEETIKKAQGTIKSALIGLIIVLMAWGIVYFIFTYLPFSAGSSVGSIQGGTSGL